MAKNEYYCPKDNKAFRVLLKIRVLEEVNEDITLRPDIRERNEILLEHYTEQLEYYEIRN